MTLPARTSWLRIVAIYLCGVGGGLQFAKTSVLFEALGRHYSASPALAGWLVSAVGIVGVVFGASAGLAVARFGTRATLIVALGAGAVISFIETSMPPVGVFLALRALEGAAHLAIVVAAPTCITALTAERERPLALGLWATYMSVAFVIAGAAAPPLVAAYGIAAPFFVHGAYLVVMAALAFMVAPAAPRPDTGPISLGGLLDSHIEVYANPRTATPALAFLAYTGMYLAVQTLTPQLVAPEARAGLIVGMAIVSIVASLAAGALAHRGYSPYVLTISAFAATLIGSLIVEAAVVAGFGVGPAALLRMAFLSFLPGAILPLIPRLNADGPSQARAFGALAQTGNVGSALGPPVFAAAGASLGPVGLLLPVAALCLFGAGFVSGAKRRFATR